MGIVHNSEIYIFVFRYKPTNTDQFGLSPPAESTMMQRRKSVQSQSLQLPSSRDRETSVSIQVRNISLELVPLGTAKKIYVILV